MTARFQRGFTLIEVLVAMGVLALFATGTLMTAWRLVGLARDYVDETAADAYCHNVIYAADASSNRLERTSTLQWRITPDQLPRFVTETPFQGVRTVRPLWRSGDPAHYPTCTLAYTAAASSNLIVTVSWRDIRGNPRSRSAYATVMRSGKEGD